MSRNMADPPARTQGGAVMKLLFVVVFCLSVLSSKAHAQGTASLLQTGNDFLRQCDEIRVNQKDTIAFGQLMRCTGYIQGFLEGHVTLQVVSGVKPTYCYPENADFGQVQRIVLKWLRGNPAKSNLPLSVVMEKALIEAFPCER